MRSKFGVLALAIVLLVAPAVSTITENHAEVRYHPQNAIHILTRGFSAVVDVKAQSDAGFLDPGQGHHEMAGWYCKHSDGTFWVWTAYMDTDGDACSNEYVSYNGQGYCDSNYWYPLAVNWCATNGYSY